MVCFSLHLQLVLCTVAAILCTSGLLKVQATSIEEALFESFVSNYSKGYRNDPDTMRRRFRVFQQSLARQKRLNDYEREHGGTAVYGINQFSDLTPKEFKEMYLSPTRKIQGSADHHAEFDLGKLKGNVTQFDWRGKGVIGPIRNQQRCGSCWAFAVVETIGSAYAIQKKEKIQYLLSPQQLLSCDSDPHLDGCRGGVIYNAFESLKTKEIVIVSETIYPFKSADGKDVACQGNLPNSGVKLTGFTYYDQNVSVELMTNMLNTSPLTTSVNAVPWQDYRSGIIQHHCTDSFVDHAVQVVGYDLTGEVPFWIVRNTWGTGWGEGGYARLLRGTNICGIRDEVASVYGVLGVNI